MVLNMVEKKLFEKIFMTLLVPLPFITVEFPIILTGFEKLILY